MSDHDQAAQRSAPGTPEHDNALPSGSDPMAIFDAEQTVVATVLQRLNAETSAWLSAATNNLPAATVAFGMAQRRCGSEAQAARQWLVQTLCSHHPSGVTAHDMIAWIEQTWACGSVAEQCALMRCLNIIQQHLPNGPWPQLAGKAIRSNASLVVAALAHANPYPAAHCEQSQWNRLILKCLFTGVALHPIIDLDRRRNPLLAQQVVDYMHERRAAQRPTPPETWRCLQPFRMDYADTWQTPATELDAQAQALALHSTSEATAWADLHQHFLTIV